MLLSMYLLFLLLLLMLPSFYSRHVMNVLRFVVTPEPFHGGLGRVRAECSLSCRLLLIQAAYLV